MDWPMTYRVIHPTLPLLALLLLDCAISRPQFTEARWGDAPAPRPEEITEVTQGRRLCSRTSCVDEKVVLRRDGRASRTVTTKNGPDSLFVAVVDSVAFRALGQALVDRGFFTPGEDEGSFEPLASSSAAVSVATLCRRKVKTLHVSLPAQGALAVMDSAVAHLSWRRCCRID